jgi:hypothetical protein
MTTDRNDPKLKQILPSGQQADYLVLSDEERAKGFVRPVRQTYRHLACGTKTTMGLAIAETYARNPKFYSGTFCCGCGRHFDLGPPWNPNFLWWPDGEPVGSLAEEAEMYRAEQQKREAEKHKGAGI